MTAAKSTSLGLFFIALATLLYELLLVRIFSVTMWYHFAFMAVSIAMFGMTVGALLVYFCPFFSNEKTNKHLSLAGLAFGLTILLSFWAHLKIHFFAEISFRGFLSLLATYVVISVPFIFSGIAVCLCLTRFKQQVGKLYAADLVGAAVGCLLLSFTLENFGATSSVIFVAFMATLGSLAFALSESKKIISISLIGIVLLIGFSVFNFQNNFMRITWVKGIVDFPVIYEKWNVLSRVRVFGDGEKGTFPYGWGLSTRLPADYRVRQLCLDIDNVAFTVLTAYHGKADEIKHLKYDVTNIAHYLQKNADVGVIGVGGGRDILSALAFDQKSVTGIEINNDIIKIVTERYKDFAGDLKNNPKIKIVNSEGRSYFASNQTKYDLIQISLIDTLAATATGAYVLTENNLYTAEAWDIFFDKLKPQGILSCSRWYEAGMPAETYRLLNMAAATLRAHNISDLRDHIILVKSSAQGQAHKLGAVGTLLISPSPFSEEQLKTIQSVCKDMKFELMLAPNSCQDPVLAEIVNRGQDPSFLKTFAVNISPPTDDNPFFFQMVRLQDWLTGAIFSDHGFFNATGTFVLVALLIVVVVLTALCIIIPLIWQGNWQNLAQNSPHLAFFCLIGLGFMFVEVSQLQRFSILLGHPSYSLSVVLFTLLLSTGIGSYCTEWIKIQKKNHVLIWMSVLLGTIFAFGLISGYGISHLQGQSMPMKVIFTVASLFPLGLLLGTAFPLGMNIALEERQSITPWLWGLNGAASVCASVLEVIIAQNIGISFAYWCGAFCYVIATLVLAKTYINRSNNLKVAKTVD